MTAPTPLWSNEEAWSWYEERPWIRGFNFMPSSACNTTELWQRETFDEGVIDRELAWGADLGFNSARVFLQYLVWEHDAAGFKKRFERFLELAAKNNMSVMPVLFDDCAFGEPPFSEPFLGEQKALTPGMIAPCWTPSPGHSRVTDQNAWPQLESYIKDIVSSFKDDPRVIVWDIYNEPGNRQMGSKSLPLLEASFAWARASNPSQPLTSGIWTPAPGKTEEITAVNDVQASLSDVISFHLYGGKKQLAQEIERCRKYERPVLCTEWMARPLGGRWQTDLPLLFEEGVGCYHWGLVNGRTQAQFPWWNEPGDGVAEQGWFHDLLHTDGTPYRSEETTFIRTFLADAARKPPVAVGRVTPS